NEKAHTFFQTEAFDAFCAEQLPDFEQQAYDYFASDAFRQVLQREVQQYFTFRHEWPEKLSHYHGIHDFWLECAQRDLRASSAA
ncbi:MAG: hypothetical protein AAGJ35_11860, partial [Myxococcota bacterium]